MTVKNDSESFLKMTRQGYGNAMTQRKKKCIETENKATKTKGHHESKKPGDCRSRVIGKIGKSQTTKNILVHINLFEHFLAS